MSNTSALRLTHVEGMPLWQLLKLAAARLCADLQNGNVSEVRDNLRRLLDPHAKVILVEMAHSLSAADRAVLMQILLEEVAARPKLGRPLALRELAALQLDAEAP